MKYSSIDQEFRVQVRDHQKFIHVQKISKFIFYLRIYHKLALDNKEHLYCDSCIKFKRTLYQ